MSTAPAIAVRKPSGRDGLDPVRVLAVDDSPVVRAVFRKLVTAEPDLDFVGSVGTAEEALALLDTVSPDVILLDLEMPGMGGLDAIPRIVEKSAPARILVVSTLTVRGAEHTLAALSLGAADTLAKPRPGEFDEIYRDVLLRRIRQLGRVAKRVRAKAALPPRPPLRACCETRPELLAIGASTGGIHAMGQLLRALPTQMTLPILVTQHLPPSFSDALARQLQAASGREALVAADGMTVLPGQIYVAPGNAHLTLAANAGGMLHIRLDHAQAANGCCPSVDTMFASCARALDGKVLGIVLSGMGRDGVSGAARIVERGGTIIAQDPETSAVWGMPGAVANAGLASAVLTPEQIAIRAAACAVRS